MYDEEDLLPLSAIQHLAFCERRCALIHLEGIWDENVMTAEGQQMHQRSDESDSEMRAGVRIARAVRLRSLRLGLAGKADVVEFRHVEEGSQGGCSLAGVPGRWRPFPVEHKRGKARPERSYETQVCAQALCLEEMLGVDIPEGALFYGKTRRRTPVPFTPALRAETERLALRLHELVAAGETPPAQYEKRCRSCSLIDLCMPKTAAPTGRATRYLEALLVGDQEGEES